ncbi:MAG TPA: hypothetical protein VMU04_06500 [Candidatus Acidoferrum sp.]|nr:hypothetical protein [Candidatus Acidoferrum sp.]
MIENVLEKLGGVGMYGVISICLFFGIFVGVLLWTLRLKQPYLKTMEELPLADGTAPEPDATAAAQPGEPHERR